MGSLDNSEVVLWGVGGVGEPLAAALCKYPLSRLVLVDPHRDLPSLKERFPACEFPIDTYSDVNLDDLPFSGKVVNINATGKDNPNSSDTPTTIVTYIEEYGKRNPSSGVFLDLRPHLDVPLVSHAENSGWMEAYTGHGMNVVNDYALLDGICRYMEVPLPPYETFAEAVRAAS